jgi:hypothetical protein
VSLGGVRGLREGHGMIAHRYRRASSGRDLRAASSQGQDCRRRALIERRSDFR